MKFIFALSFVLVAAATAFVPTASVGRVGSTASRTRSNVVLLVRKKELPWFLKFYSKKLKNDIMLQQCFEVQQYLLRVARHCCAAA